MSRVPDRLRALSDLSGQREVLLCARVCAFACLVPLLMRMPLSRMARLLQHDVRTCSCDEAKIDGERLAVIVESAQRAGHPLVRRGCLTRGVTLFWFLRRAGAEVELCFGLGAERGDYSGHCWLTLDGEPFLERVDPRPRFTEHYRLRGRLGA